MRKLRTVNRPSSLGEGDFWAEIEEGTRLLWLHFSASLRPSRKGPVRYAECCADQSSAFLGKIGAGEALSSDDRGVFFQILRGVDAEAVVGDGGDGHRQAVIKGAELF